MQATEALIRNVVQQVLAEVGQAPPPYHRSTPRPAHGVFADVDDAVAAARAAFEQLSARTLNDRKRIVGHIRRIAIDQAVELGTMEMEETQIGKLSHKIDKLRIMGRHVPGVEFLSSQVFSGDDGLAVIEHAPFGVIGTITPVTHSLPTLASNAINMVAAGNTLVVNPHPGGKRVAVDGARRFNEAIHQDLGIDNLICVIAEPTLESAEAIFRHRDVNLLCVTGGPAVARAAMNTGKRAIVAGPGNPPVVVDETADLARAARSIISGGGYDNNLLCIGEKEVFVVDKVFSPMMDAMRQAGARRLDAAQIDRLTSAAMATVGEADRRHLAPAKQYIGQDAAVLARGAGCDVPADTELLYGETDEANPFVSVEQMMPFIPFVRARDIDDAIAMAKHHEHGYRHTSIIHTTNVTNMTKMGRAMDTTLFVKNGPSTAGVGVGGEGYMSYSIATPTGEGVTTPLTFTRERRCTLVDDLRILGK